MIDVQVVFEREDYNYQGMYEEKVGLRIGDKVQWYGHIASINGVTKEEQSRYETIKMLLLQIVRKCEE